MGELPEELDRHAYGRWDFQLFLQCKSLFYAMNVTFFYALPIYLLETLVSLGRISTFSNTFPYLV